MHPINMPDRHNASPRPPYQLILSTHPLNSPYRHTLSTYLLNPPSPRPPSPINPPSQLTFSTSSLPHQPTLSTHLSTSSLPHQPILSSHLSTSSSPPIDPGVLALLRTFLPAPWFEADHNQLTPPPMPLTRQSGTGLGTGLGLVMVDATASGVTDEWLQGLWSYLIDHEAVPLFHSTFPLLPVLTPPSPRTTDKGTDKGQDKGSDKDNAAAYLVKLSPDIPVLHMSFQSLHPLALGALATLGIFVLHSKVMQRPTRPPIRHTIHRIVIHRTTYYI